MKRVLATLLCLLLALSIVVLAACDGGEGPGPDGPDDGHVHTYKTGTDWSKDANGHWYEATCDCADVTPTKFAHVDDDDNGLCDVCKFALCEHTYSEDWTADCTNHWNAADCGCIVAGQNLAAHVDENNDGECDVCKYVIEDLHTHYYATEWTTDGEYHWHAALCEHGAEVADKAAHEINAAGYCTVCSAKIRDVDRADILAVLNAAVASNNKIVNGTVTFAELVDDGATGKINEIFYTLGNDASYIFYNSYGLDGTYRGGDQQWYERIGEDEYFGVQMVAGSRDLVPAAGGAQFLGGYNYTPGQLLAKGYDDTSTLSQTLANMYDQMHNGENVLSKNESYDPETGVYTFAYVIFSVDPKTSGGEIYEYAVELYSVSVDFRINEDFVIYLANIGVATYRNWEMDMDLEYDPETNTVTLYDNATATFYGYEVSQTSGERTYTTIYPKASFMPVDFDLFYVTGTDYDDSGSMYIVSEEKIENNILTLKQEEYVRLHLGNPIPAAALLSFMDTDDFTMTYVNKNSGEAGILWEDKDFLRPSYSGYMDCIAFKVKDAGEYTVTITFGDVTKTLEITVPGEAPVAVPENTADTYYVKTTDTYTYADEYTFVAPESGTYTFTIPAGLGFLVGDNYVSDYYSSSTATYTFTLAAGKSLDFAVGAEVKNVVYAIQIAFVAHEVEDDGEEGGDEGGSGVIGNIVGTYYAGSNVLKINEDGTMTFTMGSTVLNYTYTITDGEISYSLNGNPPYTEDHNMAGHFGYLIFDAEGKPVTFAYNGSTYTLTTTPPAGGGDEGGDEGGNEGGEPEAEGTLDDPRPLDSINGTADADGDSINKIFYTFEATANGVLTITYPTANSWIDFYDSTDGQNNSGSSSKLVNQFALIAGHTYVLGLGTWDAEVTATVSVTLSFEEGAELGGDEGGEGGEEGGNDAFKDSLEGFYPHAVGDLWFHYFPEDEAYLVNIYNTPAFDLYFTYEVVDNGDGSYTFALTYFAKDVESGVDMLGTVLAEEYIGIYDAATETWSFGEAAEGTEENPIEFFPGEQIVCEFPGGYSPVWYSFQAMLGGYVTVSSEYANAFLRVGLNTSNLIDNIAGYDEENDYATIFAEEIKIYVPAGSVCYISVADNDNEAATIPVDVTFEPFFSDDWSGVVGTWTADIQSMFASASATLVINADGTGSYTEDYGYYVDAYTISYLVVDGTTLIIGCASDYSEMILTMTIGEGELTYAPDAYTSASFTQGGNEGGDEGGDEGDDDDDNEGGLGSGTRNDPYIVGELPFTFSYIGAHDCYYKLTVTEDCVISIAYTAGSYVSGLPGSAEYDVANRVYTFSMTAGSSLVFNPWTTSAAATEYVYTVSKVEAPAGGEEGGEEGGEGETGEVLTYISAVASNGRKMKVEIDKAANTMIVTRSDMTGNFTGGATSVTFTSYAEVVAGTARAQSGSAMIQGFDANGVPTSIAWGGVIFTDFVSDQVDEGGDEGGDDVAGEVLTYISAVASNGRKMKVEIDKAANTMIVTRSDATGNFTAGATSVTYTSYAEVVAGTASAQSGSAMIQGFDANGVPTIISWMGVNFTDFVQQ